MTHPTRNTSRKYRRKQREGAALLIVLFVLMMATTTAVFAMQSTQFEQRAAGALQQAMRTKYISEAATNGVLAVCLERATAGCADGTHDANLYFGANERQKYGLPDVGTNETVSSLSRNDIAGATWNAPADTATQTSADVLLPTDAMLIDATTPANTVASSYRPNFVTSVEKWSPSNVPNPDKYRLVISTYGSLALASDATLATGELRAAHESISATRAFFDVK